MLRNDGLLDLNLYLSLMQEEVTKTRQQLNELSNRDRQSPIGLGKQAWLITMEGNFDQLARITGRR